MSGPVSIIWQVDGECDVIYNHILNELDEVPVFSRNGTITQQPQLLGRFSQQTRHTNPVLGIKLLENVDEVRIQQTMELHELISIMESENRFYVKGDFGDVIFGGTENSSAWQRMLFGHSRRFILRLFDRHRQEALFCIRRLASSNPYLCCYLQRMDVFIPPCEYLGCIQQQWSLDATILTIRNLNNEDIFTVLGPTICCSCTLFNSDIIFEIRKKGCPNTYYSIIYYWEEQNNLTVKFQDADYSEKALILSCAFLIEYMFFQVPSKNSCRLCCI